MNKNQVIDTFNKHFIEFIIDIERVFPDDADIMSTRKTISKSLVVMPKILIRMFYEHFVIFYSEQIESGNLDFFIENDYRKSHGYKETDESWVIDKIDVLRIPVKNMCEEDKAKVVQYLKNLKKLSDLYNDLRKVNLTKK
jgi:hypothetical protein